MADRSLLHRNKLSEFIKWLGDRSLTPVGQWEVARWKGGKGQPMRIVFDNDHSCEHLSCNDAAYRDVRAFIRHRRAQNTKELNTTTQPQHAICADCGAPYIRPECICGPSISSTSTTIKRRPNIKRGKGDYRGIGVSEK